MSDRETVVPDFGAEDDRGDLAAASLLTFLEAVNNFREVQAYKPLALESLGLEPGMTVLDVGTGTGFDAIRFASVVGNTGRVIAIDKREAMVAHTLKRASEADTTIEARVGTAEALPFPVNTFDRAYCERVLLHLPDPIQAVAEMARTLKPGGIIVMTEPDLSSLTFAGKNEDLTRAIVLAQAKEFNCAVAGKLLPQFVNAAGLELLSHEPIAMKHSYQSAQRLDLDTIATLSEAGEFPIPRADVRIWLQEQEDLERSGCFVCNSTMYIAAAQKVQA